MPDSDVKRQPVTRVTDPSELLRRSRLTPSEVRKEMHTERLVHEAKERKIRKPWRYDTEKPLAEPPDINYREMIIDDQEMMNEVLQRKNLHFSQRCLEYQTLDLGLEWELLGEYEVWTKSMLSHAQEAGETKREEFYSKLQAFVSEDWRAVSAEWNSQFNFMEDRRIWLGKIDLKVTYPSCYCTGCTSDKIRTKHEELERAKVAAGREDFRNGIKDCPYKSCLNKRQPAEDRHEMRKKEAEHSGNLNFTNGVPGCDCENCVESKAYRAQHKELKHEELDRGIMDFTAGVPGCQCRVCRKARRKAEEKGEKTLHEELKQKQVNKGNADFRAGVEGCNCYGCRKAKKKKGLGMRTISS